MKKALKIVLIVLIVLLVLSVAIGVWQRENIAAFIDGLKYSQEDISALINDNEKIITEALDDYPDMEVREVEDEELKAFEEGKISQDELVKIVLGQTSLEQTIEEKNDQVDMPANSENPSKQEPDTQDLKPNNSSNGDSEVAALVAKVYVLKSTYVSKLDGLIAEAKAEFIALPKDKRNTASKQKILSSKLSKASGMETECNAAIEAILSDLTEVLKKYNKDTSLVASIRKAYNNEKQLKKSYYISKYLD